MNLLWAVASGWLLGTSPDADADASATCERALDVHHIIDRDVDAFFAGDSDDSVTLAFTGDIGFVRGVNALLTPTDAPLAPIATILARVDLAVTNLEGPLVADCKATTVGMTLCGVPALGQHLQAAGVDVVSLANNHSFDHGIAGLTETTTTLNQLGLVSLVPDRYGLSESVALNVRGHRVAFLGINTVSVGPVPLRRLRTAVSQAQHEGAFVVVLPHWGEEYVHDPLPSTGNAARIAPRRLARMLADVGAGLVIGNHPHRVQGLEWIGATPIAYAHGNTLFDQRSLFARTSTISLWRIRSGCVVDAAVVPLRHRGRAGRFVVEPLTGADAVAARALLHRLSRRLQRVTRIDSSPAPGQE